MMHFATSQTRDEVFESKFETKYLENYIGLKVVTDECIKVLGTSMCIQL